MEQLIPSLAVLLEGFADCFRHEVFQTFRVLVAAWATCPGPHTISEVWQATGLAARRHHDLAYSLFHSARWDWDDLAKVLVLLVVAHLLPTGTVWLVVDDTLAHKRGQSVWGLGWFRDAVASTRKRVATASGHNWVVMAVAFCWPGSGAPILAIPLLARLHRGDPSEPGPSQLAKEMLAQIAGWYPDKQITLVGDGAYASKELLAELQAGVEFVGGMAGGGIPFVPLGAAGGADDIAGELSPEGETLLDELLAEPLEALVAGHVGFPQVRNAAGRGVRTSESAQRGAFAGRTRGVRAASAGCSVEVG